MKKWIVLFSALLIVYLPSFSAFFTNDDFFLLNISRAENFGQFIGFFNFLEGPMGLGMYRPLTIQVFYFLAHIFNFQTFPLHIVVFGFFLAVIFAVFKFTKLFLSEKYAYFTTALYALSATHFAHLYYFATFQELGLTLFFLLSCINFQKYLDGKNAKHALHALVFFVLALLSKETAVVLPFALILLYLFKTKGSLTKFRQYPWPIFASLAILILYLYFHFFHYGLATGDSYIWDFGPRRLLNTLVWYLLWSFNLPEMFVDFVGPGFKLNPTLFKFWGREVTTIFALFAVQIALLLAAIVKNGKWLVKSSKLIMFSVLWFVGTLVPVLFLPIHKFTFYLTLPLVGVVLIIGHLFEKIDKNALSYLFAVVWIAVALSTLDLTKNTHWITRGQEIAVRVHVHMGENIDELSEKQIVFVDTENDSNLPWSPTTTVKTALSDQNYWQVFWPGLAVSYGSCEDVCHSINSRVFLGY